MTAEVVPTPSSARTSAASPVDVDLSRASAQLLCRFAHQLLALPIEYVIEIMRPLAVEPIAGAPAYVRGVCVIRGTPVPVVDVGLLTGNRQTQSARLVTVRAGSHTVALQVGSIVGIKPLDVGTFKELPPLLRDLATETIASIGTLDSELLLTLEVARIVPDGVFSSLEQARAPS